MKQSIAKPTQKFRFQIFLQMEPGALGKLGSCESPQAFQAPWRLPHWPSKQDTASYRRSAWASWSGSHRLPVRVARNGRASIEAFVKGLAMDECPLVWSAFEGKMGQALQVNSCIAQDGMISNKLWSARPEELVAATLNGGS